MYISRIQITHIANSGLNSKTAFHTRLWSQQQYMKTRHLERRQRRRKHTEPRKMRFDWNWWSFCRCSLHAETMKRRPARDHWRGDDIHTRRYLIISSRRRGKSKRRHTGLHCVHSAAAAAAADAGHQRSYTGREDAARRATANNIERKFDDIGRRLSRFYRFAIIIIIIASAGLGAVQRRPDSIVSVRLCFQLRFDRRSTPIRLQFHPATIIRRPTLCS